VAYGLQEQPNLDARSRSLLQRAVMLLVAVILGSAAYLLFSSEETRIEVTSPMPRALGLSSPVRVRMSNPQGVARARAWIEQNGARYELLDAYYQGTWQDWFRKGRAPVEPAFVAGKDRAPGLVHGNARLVIQAEANNFRGRETRWHRDFMVVLGKPQVFATKTPVFLRRGGTGIVSFTVGGEWSSAGVKVGKLVFPSFPAVGNPNQRIAMFALPPQAAPETRPVLFAANLAGDEVTLPFRAAITPVDFRDREVRVADPFLKRVIPAIDPSGSGEIWARFARVNAEVRRANDQFLADLSAKSAPRQLWKGPFQLLTKATNEARFADFRTYVYQGREINREWHLGVDLASVKNAPIPAANQGKVLFAGVLGIYGNCVVIDHGLGVQSVYGHMSKIDVKTGDEVAKGQILGRTGMTGLAGGDHVHIALLLHGVFVDPVEWSLPKWMDKTMNPLLSQIAAPPDPSSR
jgi:murein DD-endopeptidase MepM/ murein hydrolase activator NlpD